jgi:hypothetical protein
MQLKSFGEIKKSNSMSLSLTIWPPRQVADWLVTLNVPAPIVDNFLDNDISGELLVHANHDLLKELMVISVGHRIVILKSLYNLKVTQGIKIDPEDYIPESMFYLF